STLLSSALALHYPYTTLFRSIAEVENDAVAVGVFGALVDFAGNDVVRDDVVEAGIPVEPLVGVEGDAARPAIPLRDERHLLQLRSEEHTSELQSPYDLVCRVL